MPSGTETLRITDPHFVENQKILKQAVGDLEIKLPPEEFRRFWELHNDPTKINPKSGQPYFLELYRAVDSARRQLPNSQPQQQQGGRHLPALHHRPGAVGW